MELYIPPVPLTRNPTNGRILPGFVPKNKGKKWGEFKVPKRSRKKILANLNDAGRRKGALASKTRTCIKVVGIMNGEIIGMFESAAEAEKKIKGKGIAIRATNIRHCCKGKRPRAGGIKWFYESDFEKWNEEIKEG